MWARDLSAVCGSCPVTSRLEAQNSVLQLFLHVDFQSWAGHSPVTSGALAAFSLSTTEASHFSR